MAKSKNIVYKTGMKFQCGPPLPSGGYKVWNWCKMCMAIHEKKYKRCLDCNQPMRSKAPSQNNTITRQQRLKDRIAVQIDLLAWQKGKL
jgi:hypothetical protein